MSKIKIFIDAGHNDSGFNTGAIGNGMREQDVNFDVAFYLGQILAEFFDIKLSRPTRKTNLGHDNNSSINTRVQMSNQWGADYFISIHANAGGGTGAETFYWNENAKKFALAVQKTYACAMALRDRRTELTNRFGVIRSTNCPAILIELAFLDAPPNKPDIDILRDKRLEMAQAIAKGVFKYFNVETKYKNENVYPGYVNIKYRNVKYIIEAENQNGRYIINLHGLSKVFGNKEVPIRALLELAGLTVGWDGDTGTILVNQ